MNQSDPESPRDNPDAAAVSASLAQLTPGWTPAAGVSPETLVAARRALADILLSGKSVQEIHAVTTPVKASPPVNPQLSAELLEIAMTATAASRQRTLAVVRSSLAVTASNPTGRPAWAQCTAGPNLRPVRGSAGRNALGGHAAVHGFAALCLRRPGCAICGVPSSRIPVSAPGALQPRARGGQRLVFGGPALSSFARR